MNKQIKNLGLGVALLGMATIASSVSAANFTRCSSASIVAVTDTQSCNTASLSYANVAGTSFVRANLVRISPAVGFGIENVGRDVNRAVIQGCVAGVNGGGATTDNTCGGLVRFHEFRIRR